MLVLNRSLNHVDTCNSSEEGVVKNEDSHECTEHRVKSSTACEELTDETLRPVCMLGNQIIVHSKLG